MTTKHPLLIGLATMSLFAVSCGGGDPTPEAEAAAPADASDSAGAFPAGVVTVSAPEAAALIADAPEDLVVLDVRTPEEFAAGHLAGAVLVDFYDADFADQLAALDPELAYVVYCRSGSRSGQAMPLLDELGFTSAVNINGGILAWDQAGLPVTAD